MLKFNTNFNFFTFLLKKKIKKKKKKKISKNKFFHKNNNFILIITLKIISNIFFLYGLKLALIYIARQFAEFQVLWVCPKRVVGVEVRCWDWSVK